MFFYNDRTLVVFMGILSIYKWAIMLALLLNGCATELPAIADSNAPGEALAIGRIATVITGETRRIYDPALRSFELVNRGTHERLRVDIQSDDHEFILYVPPGEYELIRVQINEGPFMSMAHLSSSFAVRAETVTYLGTWRFGVDSPRYGRMVVLSIVADEEDRDQLTEAIRQKYPAQQAQPVVTGLPVPAESETRLYEVMSYPRVPRYFQRHQW